MQTTIEATRQENGLETGVLTSSPQANANGGRWMTEQQIAEATGYYCGDLQELLLYGNDGKHLKPRTNDKGIVEYDTTYLHCKMH